MAVNGSLNSSNHWSTNRSDIPEFEHSPISEPPYSPTDRVHIFDNKSPPAQSDTDFDLTVNTDFCLPISAELEEISQTDIEEVLNNHRNMDVGDSTWNQIYTDNVVQNEHIPTMNGEFMFMDERRVSDLSCSHLTMDSSYQANIDAWTESTLNYTSQTCIPSVTTSQSLPTGPEPSLLDISQIKKEAPDLSEQSFSCSGAPESSDQSYCSSSGIPEVDDWGLQGSEVSYLSTDSYRDVVKNEHQTRNCCVLETPGDRKPQKRLKLKTLPLEERKARRRMQNRDAARRCRMKKRQNASTLVQDYHQMVANQRSMNQEILELKRSKAALEEVLREHNKRCPLMMNRRC